ncbi:MAG TPA: hypothetical protein VHZ52_11500 [Acidobacteriaceae bacterium]|jgi:hypothetical protein|nr:hypothetical protein [Acidobacteriaceae bacterium]
MNFLGTIFLVELGTNVASQAETVAFWFEFIGTVVGIVLSLVAIVFSILVDRRSNSVSAHTIQSLQKIESVVEHLSSDTRELIKAGWEKMLGGVDQRLIKDAGESSAKQIAAGIAAELRSELASLGSNSSTQNGESGERPAQIEKYLKDFEVSLKAQLAKVSSETRPSEKLDDLLVTIRGLSVRGRALLSAIRGMHLNPMQYRRLSAGPLEESISELRRAGLIVPLVHGDTPCYYLPPGTARIARTALGLLPRAPSDVSREVYTELSAVGYVNPNRSSTRNHLENLGDTSED